MSGVASFLLAAPCPACGAAGGLCRACIDVTTSVPGPEVPGVDQMVSLSAHHGWVRQAVAAAKYVGRREVLGPLGEALADRVLARRIPIDAVVGVPASAARRRTRGIDHGQVLADAVAARLGRPSLRALVRAPGSAQTGRSAADRRRSPPRLRVRGRLPPCVLVVDDVVTTGTTLGSAAAVLRLAGATSVTAAVVAVRR